MKKSILFFLFVSCFTLSALNIPAGSYFFDNSKTKWSVVKFVYGTDSPPSSVILDLTDQGNNIWKLELASPLNNQYRYSFSNTALTQQSYPGTSFSSLKDNISNRGEQRTATTEAQPLPQYTFVPSSGDNWAQGSWVNQSVQIESPTSGVLPIFYLNTEGNVEITSKDQYVKGSLYVDALQLQGLDSYGSKELPAVSEFKGRGNYTWNGFEKKPYRIKMSKGGSILGLPSDKSYTLLAHADDPSFLRNQVGFELSRRIGLAYTPNVHPVELMKNNSYHGLYFLTDYIKISSVKVDIIEQEVNLTDPALITGGWLLEMDNYDDSPQVSTQRVPRFTIKSPDALSSVQENYIKTKLQQTEDAIYMADKNSREWERYIDLQTFVKYYMVQEIMGNTESFHGSCYIHKDRAEDAKFHFGPVWDFGNSYRTGHDLIYERYDFSCNWLPEIAKFPRFKEQVVLQWNAIRSDVLGIIQYINLYTSMIEKAVAKDAVRWPQYGSKNYSAEKQTVINYLQDRIAWLDSKWSLPDAVEKLSSTDVNLYPNPAKTYFTISARATIHSVQIFDLTGKMVASYDGSLYYRILFPKGSYLVVVKTSQGSERRKLIIE